MKTNFAYIEEAVEKAAFEPRVVKITERVAGFEFETEKEVGGRDRTYLYRKERLLGALKDADITPLAVLPTRWWRKIIEESGMIIAGDNGRFNVNSESEPIRTATGAALIMFGLTTFLLAGLIAYSIAPAHFSMPEYLGVLFMATLLIGAFTGSALALIPFTRGIILRTGARLAIALHGGRDETLRKIVFAGRGSGIGYTLPTPPKDVVDIIKNLQKNSDFDMLIAAEPSAFALDAPLHSVIAREIDAGTRAKISRTVADALADPIIFVESGGVTAVLAQFGEFPIEKEVIDRLVETYDE